MKRIRKKSEVKKKRRMQKAVRKHKRTLSQNCEKAPCHGHCHARSTLNVSMALKWAIAIAGLLASVRGCELSQQSLRNYSSDRVPDQQEVHQAAENDEALVRVDPLRICNKTPTQPKRQPQSGGPNSPVAAKHSNN
ncbi:MAG: hypothetical protein IH624_07340 [Phycisphaerae bacterium]|nr:hypothetical protein [Phycisphaerae bacterium]